MITKEREIYKKDTKMVWMRLRRRLNLNDGG